MMTIHATDFRVQNNENGDAIKNKGFVRLLRQLPPGNSVSYALWAMGYVLWVMEIVFRVLNLKIEKQVKLITPDMMTNDNSISNTFCRRFFLHSLNY